MSNFSLSKEEYEDMMRSLKQLDLVVNGNPQLDNLGLRERMKQVEKELGDFLTQWSRLRWITYGVLMGLGVAQASVLGIVIKILSLISGTTP
jgi:MinD-like ATPase involved in chromosome partitioning or flagellar assembly